MVMANSVEVENNFSKYLELSSNEEIVITKDGAPFARLLRLVPEDVDDEAIKDERLNACEKRPVFGCAKGQFKMADDFDAPLEDFKEYM
jgi:antitoxin (DNA-binding transcriptional repressor) of toxin-antitoxin stability system